MNRADQRKFHYIYKITRVDGSGKYYIGMHSTDDLEDGYFGSGHLIARSVRAHGKEAHGKEILEFLPSRKELKDRERVLVNEEILDDPRCMNLRLGGEGGGGFFSDAHRMAFQTSGGQSKGGAKSILKNKCDWSGRQHSVRARKKIGEANRKFGASNSQYGTCWVSKAGEVRKTKLAALPALLEEGWQRGRKKMEQCP